MNVLVLAEHDNAAIARATLNTVTAAQQLRRRGRSCSSAVTDAGRRGAAARIAGVDARSCWPMRRTTRTTAAENLAELVASLRRRATAISWRRPRPTAKTSCRASRRCSTSAQMSRHHGDRVRRYVRAPDLCRQRAGDGAAASTRSRSSRCARTAFEPAAATAAAPASRRSRRRPTAAVAAGRRAARSPSPSVRS